MSNWLLTPPLTIQNGVVLSFWTRTVDTPSFPDRLQVRLSTNGASTDVGTLATDVGDFTTLLLDINPTYTTTGYPTTWTPVTVTLSGLGSPTTGRLALRYFVENGGPSGANSDYIGIDALQIAGPCNPQPTPIPSPTPAPGPELMIFNSWGAFGSEMVGSSSNPIQFRVFHNFNGTATGLSISLSGSDATNFSITSNGCGSTLGDHDSCFVSVKFHPFTAGSKSATLSAQANCAQCNATASLTGTGRPLTATPAPTPTPGPPTPTPICTPCSCAPAISGTVAYCPNPSLGPVPNVTMTLTGTVGGSTLTNGSGNYSFAGLTSGGSYTVTPAKTALTPGSAGINTVDVIATQRHFLTIGTPLSGCRLTAADVNGNGGINTVDVIAIQRFFLGITTGIGNVGKYQFTPANRTYSGIGCSQGGQNYDTLVFGDVAAGFVHRPDSLLQDGASKR